MKTVIFLGSYSGGGASTAIKLLREMGIPCVSTSEILYEFIEKVESVSSCGYFEQASKKEGRKNRVAIAEDCIKSTFGSRVFPLAAAHKIKVTLCDADVAVMDCFDANEYVFARKALGNEFENIILNIRSPKEQPEIDRQELLQAILHEPVHTIQNPMTIEGLKADLEKVLALAKVPQKQ